MKNLETVNSKNGERVIVYMTRRERNYLHSVSRLHGSTFFDLGRALVLRFITEYKRKEQKLKINKEIDTNAAGIVKITFFLKKEELDELNEIFDALPERKVRGHFLRQMFLTEFKKIENNLLRD